MSRLEKKFDQVKFFEVDVDKEPELAKDFDVEFLPTTLIVVDGRVRKKWVGVQSYNKMAAELQKQIGLKDAS